MTYYPPQGVVRWGYGIHPPQGVRVVPVVPPPIPSLSKTVDGEVFHDNFDDNFFDTTVWDTGGYNYVGSVDEVNQRLEITMRGKTAVWSDLYAMTKSTFPFTEKRVYQVFLSVPSTASYGRVVGIFLLPTYPTTTKLYDEADWFRFMIWIRSVGPGYWATKKIAGVHETIKAEEPITDFDIRVLIVIDKTNIEIYIEGVQWLAPTAHNLTFDTPYIYLQNSTNTTETITTIHDDMAVFKDIVIKVTTLQEGQKVELYDSGDTLVDSKTVGAGETSVSLDVSAKTIPFNGYFKVYRTDGVTLWYRYPKTGTIELWGGDEYAQT